MPTLQRDSTGPEVKALQQRLKDLGFDPNGVDGHFGPGTVKAVRAFQKANRLGVDGKVGPNTRAALQLDSAAASDAASAATAGTGETPGSGELNLAALKGIIPDAVIAQIPETAARFGITSNLRLAHFLAQCALESTGFTDTFEKLNYRAERIRKVFPKYFKNIDTTPYANNPQKLANRVYANRLGNGDEASGDGYKYRGRGFIQLTGKNNYSSFSNFVGEDCVANPDVVANKYPLSSAAFYFSSNNIWKICDRGADNATVRKVSIAVNGDPPHAVPERTQNFKRFMKALS